MVGILYNWLRRLPWWAQLLGLPAWVVLAAAAGLLGLVVSAAGGGVKSFTGWTVKGAPMTVLLKLAGVLILAGGALALAGAEELGGTVMMFAALPIMLIGLVGMVAGFTFKPAKKGKKK